MCLVILIPTVYCTWSASACFGVTKELISTIRSWNTFSFHVPLPSSSSLSRFGHTCKISRYSAILCVLCIYCKNVYNIYKN